MFKFDKKKWIADRHFYKHVLIVATPLMLQQLIMSAVNLVDNLMVGQLGDAAIGGVGVVNRYYMIGNFSAMGIAAAASIFIAQFYGAKDNEHLKQTFRYAIFAVYTIIIPFTLFALFAPGSIVGFFTKDPAYMKQGIEYMTYAAYSFIPLGLILVISNSLRSIGEAKIALYTNVMSVLINAFFNYILIFGHFGMPAMGVAGAAIATVIARVVECIVLLVIVKKYDYPFKTKLSEMFHVSGELIKKITLKAVPLLMNELMWSAGMAMLLKLYAERGADVITAYSVAGTAGDLFFSLFGGMAGATTIIIGQKLGANQLEEAKANGYHLLSFAVLLSFVLGFGIFICSYFVPYLYDLTPETRELASNILKIMSVMFWIYMMNAESYFILRAGGDTFSTMLMDSCFMWLVNIPVVAAVTYFTKFNIYFVYICGQLTDLLKMMIALRFVRKEKWVKNLTDIQDS